jgi:hypothetical protein
MDRTNAERQRRYIARLKQQAAAQGGVTNASAVAKLEARIRELEAELARARADAVKPGDDLPKSYRERYEARVRRLEREFEDRVKQRAGAEASRLLDEVFLPNLRERLEKAEHQQKVIDGALDRRRPLMTKALFRKVLACLHPDSRTGASETMRNEAFAAFSEKNKDGVNQIEIALCGREADRPKGRPRPTWAEIMAAREKVRAERSARAKRAAATRAARKT